MLGKCSRFLFLCNYYKKVPYILLEFTENSCQKFDDRKGVK